jgi:hypothetical protein
LRPAQFARRFGGPNKRRGSGPPFSESIPAPVDNFGRNKSIHYHPPIPIMYTRLNRNTFLRLIGAINMRIIDSENVITEEDIEIESSIRLISTDEVIDKYFPQVRFHRNEFDEYFGHGVKSKDQRKNSANPVFAEFRRVQNKINVLSQSKKSYGDKRRESAKLLQDFKAFLRGKNIRYRNLWRQLQFEGF